MMNPMIRNILVVLVILAITYVSAQWLLNTPVDNMQETEGEYGFIDEHKEEFPRGLHGGRLLQDGNLVLEITIYETGIPPEFHVYPYYGDKPVDPASVSLMITLQRTGGVSDIFHFIPQQDYLRGEGIVTEPHSFDVNVEAQYQGNSYRWFYENHEGRTRIPGNMAAEAGIKTEIAGPVSLDKIIILNGRVQIDPNRLSHVRPRFPGMVEAVYKKLGDTVTAGQVLVTVQSNESLQSYDVKAPISGLITKRSVQVGESTGDEPLFIIADLSQIWVELDIFARDLATISAGQSVMIETLDGYRTEGLIDWISPLTAHASQSVQAIVPLSNPDEQLRPGQFVRGHVRVAEYDVPLAVRRSAVQSFRDFQVVFARFGETYEVRMLELGRSNSEWVEVLDGLVTGTEYVTENSYLIKADIEKSGASHDH